MLLKAYVTLFSTVSIGYAIGRWFDTMESERLSGYRDKSALFGRELKPGERPSWP